MVDEIGWNIDFMVIYCSYFVPPKNIDIALIFYVERIAANNTQFHENDKRDNHKYDWINIFLLIVRYFREKDGALYK